MDLSRRGKYALLTLFIVLTCSQILFAHAILEDSTPAKNSTVSGPDMDITLRYNVRVDGARSRLNLIGPDTKQLALPIAKQDDHPDIIQSKATGLKPGAYKLEWHVLASDGHMSKGEVAFTVK